MQLLLISSSMASGQEFLGHCKGAITELLEHSLSGDTILMIPYAKTEDRRAEYADKARDYFAGLGQKLVSIDEFSDPVSCISSPDCKAIFVPGGNAFLLVKTLQVNGLIEPICSAVQNGISYIGISAGTNVACPTMQTTNDMPIVYPSSFDALGLINFQINAHYVAGSLIAGHHGETREQRIEEYQRLNKRTVVGLPEASWIRVDGDKTMLSGTENAVIFEPDQNPRQRGPGTYLL